VWFLKEIAPAIQGDPSFIENSSFQVCGRRIDTLPREDIPDIGISMSAIKERCGW
jgi:hypothetical protein